MNRAKKLIYIIAGEASGDRLGADLMRSLQTLYPGTFRFKGIGGQWMKQQGLRSLFSMDDINHMGLIEVLKYLPLLVQRLRQTVDHIKKCAPDMLITIDSPDFTLRVGKRVRSVQLPHMHYVAPTVWAWRPKRAKKMAQQVDHLFTLYDFEPPYFLRENLATTFVGHPLSESFEFFQSAKDQDYMALLPGSRVSEITRLLPIFLDSVRILQQKFPTLKYWLPTLPGRQKIVEDIIKQYQLTDCITVVSEERIKETYFQSSVVALAASGTATLELALMGIPTVIAYKIHFLSALLGKWLIKTPFIGLPNIILQECLMPELIQDKCCVAEIISYLEKFIANKSYKNIFQEKRKILLERLKTDLKASDKAATVMYQKIFNH